MVLQFAKEKCNNPLIWAEEVPQFLFISVGKTKPLGLRRDHKLCLDGCQLQIISVVSRVQFTTRAKSNSNKNEMRRCVDTKRNWTNQP